MTGPLVTLKDVTVGYGRHIVLQGINLQLARGSLTGLLGANGSGKSTLLKTILGILPPISGRIEFASVNGRAPGLGYVPQRDRLDPIFLLTVFEVVLMGVCGRVAPGQRIRQDEKEFVATCLTATGVESLQKKRFSEISGGQLQRVLIARALASRPDFLLLDEPIAGIDPAASQSILDLLLRIHTQQQITVLLVSHDLAAVRKYVRDVIWLHNGQTFHGAVSEMLDPSKVQEMLNLAS